MSKLRIPNQESKRIVSKPLISYVDLDELGIDPGHIPDKGDFVAAYNELNAVQKETVRAMLQAETFQKVLRMLKQYGVEHTAQAKQRMDQKPVKRAFYYGTVAKMTSYDARVKLVKDVFAQTSIKVISTQQVEALVRTDKGHLENLAEELSVDGDGKRGILRTLIAYGMQSKQSEAETLDEKGNVVAPAIIALCDPKIAYSALQELNRMDHEYGEDDKATSSIESQAARIKRLQATVIKAAAVEAKRRGSVVKAITSQQLTEL